MIFHLSKYSNLSMGCRATLAVTGKSITVATLLLMLSDRQHSPLITASITLG